MEDETKKKKKPSIMSKILIGFALGIVAGLIVGPKITVIQPLGDLFIRLLRMVVIPLVFSSLAVGMSSIGDIKKMGRIGGMFLILLLVTTCMSTAIGLVLALTIQPGSGVLLAMPEAGEVVVEAPSLLKTLLNIIPINPIEAMANGTVLQVIAFAIFLGIAMVMVGKKAEPLINILDALAESMYKITEIVLHYAPIGVFALISCVVGAQGAQVLLPMLKLVITVYLGCIITIVFVNAGFTVGLLGKLNPIKFLKAYSPAMLFSFATASSAATIPLSLKCAQERMGVSKRVSSFVQPLGATVNMNGTSLYQGICVVFIAQLMGLHLSMGQLLTVVLTALLAAVGTAGVPGAGLVMLTMVMVSIGLPPESIAIIAGVDRLLDSARGVPNVTGDAAIALTIAKWEGELDRDIFEGKKVYNAEEAEDLEASRLIHFEKRYKNEN